MHDRGVRWPHDRDDAITRLRSPKQSNQGKVKLQTPDINFEIRVEHGDVLLGLGSHLVDEFLPLASMMDCLNRLFQADGDEQPYDNRSDMDEEVLPPCGWRAERVRRAWRRRFLEERRTRTEKVTA